MNQKNIIGYLPDERPTIEKTIIFALQQFLVMLPATVLAALIMNGNGIMLYSISVAIIASGIATITFLLVTKFQIPLYYGSSFSYIGAVSIITNHALQSNQSSQTILGSVLIASLISGLMSIGAGLLIRRFGKSRIDAILPGHITGMIAMIIGLSLAKNVMNGILNMNNNLVDWYSVLVSLITFISIVLFTVKLKKGFISQVPILLGILIGVLASYFIWVPSQGTSFSYLNIMSYFNKIKLSQTIDILSVMPWNTIPSAIKNPDLIITSIIAIFPIAFATIPESAAHVNQISLYVNKLSMEKNKGDYKIDQKLDVNLIGDGVADIVAVLMGGPAGTNYGENISTSSITKNFSSYVFMFTGFIAIITGVLLEIFKIGDLSLIITNPVIQGVSLYLFGVIAVQGIALMIEKKVDIFNPKIIAVMGFIAITGLGVDAINITESLVLPGIGVAAIGGILLNLVLNFVDKK